MQDPTAEPIRAALARRDLDAAPVTEAERALLKFVALVTNHAYRTTDADVEGLRRQGWTDPQIAECIYITALFAFFNRVADAFGLEDPNSFASAPPGLEGSPDDRAGAAG